VNIQLVAIVALSITTITYRFLWLETRDDFTSYRAMVAQAQKQADERNAAKVREAESVTESVVVGMDRTVRELDRQHVSRLLQARRDCARAAANAETARLTHAATADVGSGAPSFEAICEGLERDCAKTTGQLLWLQDWTKRVCK